MPRDEEESVLLRDEERIRLRSESHTSLYTHRNEHTGQSCLLISNILDDECMHMHSHANARMHTTKHTSHQMLLYFGGCRRNSSLP
jgi:hypothetical protein